MKNQRDILTEINHKDGLTVPDGYFESFAAKLSEALPFREEAEMPANVIRPPHTLWTRIRPYVYLAAMFAGIWCMLKMFSLMISPSDANNVIDRNPVLAEAIKNDVFINDYIFNDLNQWDIIDEMIEDGFDSSSLEEIAVSDSDVTFIDPAALPVAE